MFSCLLLKTIFLRSCRARSGLACLQPAAMLSSAQSCATVGDSLNPWTIFHPSIGKPGASRKTNCVSPIWSQSLRWSLCRWQRCLSSACSPLTVFYFCCVKPSSVTSPFFFFPFISHSCKCSATERFRRAKPPFNGPGKKFGHSDMKRRNVKRYQPQEDQVMTQKQEKSEERKAIEKKAREAIAALHLRPLRCPWPFVSRDDQDMVVTSRSRATVAPSRAPK